MTFEERRRGPRAVLAAGPKLQLIRRVRVRLVDISAGGVSVTCDERLPAGTVGRLRVPLGSEPFEASVEIKREEARPELPLLLGAVIVGTSRKDEDALDQFLSRSQ